MSGQTVRRVARKHHTACGDSRHHVNPGDVYLVHTDFPGSGIGYGDYAGHPVRMAECAKCAVRYGRDTLLDPIPEHQLWDLMVAADSAYLARQGVSGD